jgi:hypothetical protein
MFVRAYVRASTSEQDASRARDALHAFAAEQGLRIAARYVQNESGAKLHRPELFRLLADCGTGGILLVEQVGPRSNGKYFIRAMSAYCRSPTQREQAFSGPTLTPLRAA